MSRITIKDVETRVKFINDILEKQNRNKRIKIGYRYNYYAIDLYNSVDSLLDTLYSGNARMLYDRLGGMLNMLTLLDNGAY